MTPIKVVQIGCGKMSKYIMQYVEDLGAEIVGAVDINPDILGWDIGQIMESPNRGVVINDVSKLEELLKETKPDIAIITTLSYLNDVADNIRVCVKNGVNVITTSEECFYAFNSNPTLTHELDVLAKANGVTVTGCGYQDVFWGSLITNIAGTTHNVTKIKGSSSYNVEDYGIALAKAHGAGLTQGEFEQTVAKADKISPEEREKIINNRKFLPSYMWNTSGWLADKLHLTPKSLTQECVPIIAEEAIHSDTLQMDIEKGMVRGMRAIATLETQEGITIEAQCIGCVYTKDEFDKNEWTVYGEPDTTIVVNKPDTVRLTCADIANRLTDVINAKPGFIPTSQMPEISYKIEY